MIENELFFRLVEEKNMRLKNSLYHFTQIKFAYNTNRIEGSLLSEDQTRYIYETNTLSVNPNETANVDDIIETVNHFSCFDYMLKVTEDTLSEGIIKEFHRLLKNGTSDSRKDWFNIGGYKTRPNMVGDIETTIPSRVEEEMVGLITIYGNQKNINIHNIIDFHFKFEKIHPFQDGNGRVGRLIMFKECLKNNITPFVIENEYKQFYYRGLKEYEKTPGFLIDTCLAAQDKYGDVVKYFFKNDLDNKLRDNIKKKNVDGKRRKR